MATTAYTAAILGWDNRTGEFVALVPSASDPNKLHVTTMRGGCDCRGFQFRGECSHTQPRRDPAKVAANASMYNQIWQDEPRPSAPRVPLVRYA